MRNILWIMLLFFLANGCLERLDIPPLSSTPQLVVDGLITDQPGPHTVRLFYSSPLNADLDNPVPLTRASVSISDNAGNVELLKEDIPGTYVTSSNGFHAVVGRTYQLKIATTDEKKYESPPVMLRAAGSVDNVFFEFQENVINPNDQSRPQDAFMVKMNASGPGGEQSLLRWRWRAIYHVKTFPELREKVVYEGKESMIVPDPLPCSGYAPDLTRFGPCECCDCYVTYYSESVLLSDNAYVSDNKFMNVPVDLVPTDKWFFYDRYYLEVEQLSVDENVYDFWKLVKVQHEGAGDIFQPNSVKVRGNIKCVSNPDEEVFGIFSASASTKGSVFIRRSDIPKRIALIDTLRNDCRHEFFNSTTEKPPFW